MTPMNEQITTNLAWIHKDADELSKALDLVELKYRLKSLKGQVESAYSTVDNELNMLRQHCGRMGKG